MSETPICDRWEYDTNQGGLVVPLNVAKDLETELAEANRKLAERINDDQRYLVAPMCNAEKALDDCQAELAEARAEVERKNKLIEQMREIINDYRIEHRAWCNHDPANTKECNCGLSEKVQAALAAERGE